MPDDSPHIAWTAAADSGFPAPSGAGLHPGKRTPASQGSVTGFSREDPCAPPVPEQTAKQYTAGLHFRLPATGLNTCNPQYQTAGAAKKFPSPPARVRKLAARSGE